jgi:hypothetical protein
VREMTSRIQELKLRVESIPQKRGRTKLVGTLTQFIQKTDTAGDTIVQSVEQREHARQVFNDDNFSKVVERVKATAADAKRVRTALSKDLNAVVDRKIDERIADISINASKTRKELNDKWAQLLESKIEGFEKLVQATAKAGMKGSKNLQSILVALKGKVGAAPVSAQSGIKIKSDLDLLVKAVKDLGLEGKPGKFLTQAAEGQGNPQSLYDPEVKQFISDNDLWTLLNVKLG